MYGAIIIILVILEPVFLIANGSLTTDIIGETCVPYGVFSSYSIQKAATSSAFLVVYLLPLMTMVFCYSRIVYSLKHKVTIGHSHCA